jgi:hypothetical protein
MKNIDINSETFFTNFHFRFAPHDADDDDNSFFTLDDSTTAENGRDSRYKSID